MKGFFFDVRKYSIHDGPGIRTAFFFKGCPLRCAWCHNPEGIAFPAELFLRKDRCLGQSSCGACRSVCPSGCAMPLDARADPGNVFSCTACGACVRVCPSGARQIVGSPLEVSDVLSLALEDEPFYAESGGGVTFSGGEPLAQSVFLRDCLTGLQDSGIHTAVDTSGYASWSEMEGVAALADLILFDLKLMDSSEHKRWTGVPNEGILENLRRLCDLGKPVWVRIPLIPGINDDSANLESSAAFLSRLGFGHMDGTERSVQILPYHDSGRGKYTARGLPYSLDEIPIPGPDAMNRALAFFDDRKIPVRIGG